MAVHSIIKALKMHNDLCKKDVVNVLKYAPRTGIFTWKDRPDIWPPANARLKNTQAGSLNSCGQRRIRLKGKLYLASRLAWLCTTGKWPKELLDHKNGKPDDNRWQNIREASRTQNACNSTAYKSNKCGLKGVCQVRPGRFVARIQIHKKATYLGMFSTPKKAHAAYKKAAKKIHKRFARWK